MFLRFETTCLVNFFGWPRPFLLFLSSVSYREITTDDAQNRAKLPSATIDQESFCENKKQVLLIKQQN